MSIITACPGIKRSVVYPFCFLPFLAMQGQCGGVTAHYCAPVHSCAVKWSRKTEGKTSLDRLITSRHQASFKMGLIASPCSWSWFKGWRQFRDALYVAKACFTRTFPQLRSPPPPCEPSEKWCTSQKKKKLFSICPAPCPRKSQRGPLQSTPHSRVQMAGLVPLVAREIVTGPANWNVHHNDSLAQSEAPVRCVPPLRCCFRFFLKFSALRKFTTTGEGYGLLQERTKGTEKASPIHTLFHR